MRLNRNLRKKQKEKGYKGFNLDESNIKLNLARKEFIFVHDEDTKRGLYLVKLYSSFRNDTVLCGPVSCGKTTMIKNMIS